MNRVAIAFSTKDRVELSKRTIEPLVRSQHALYWVDGSDTQEGQELPNKYPLTGSFGNVRGGADAAIAFSLTMLLAQPQNFSHVGLVENDVLLTDPDWFEKTMALFEYGADDGLKVGAVSARCYADRILLQRPDYAVMHNLGAGMVIYTREAAQLILKYFRTGWTNANRLLFSQLSGIDIGAYWAFRGGQHILCADWNFDTVLAAHGLASLALTPSPVEMIGQTPSLAEQGLTLATGSVTERIDDYAFQLYCDRTQAIREGKFAPAWPGLFHVEPGCSVIFPHQLPYIGSLYSGDWLLKWTMGFGPFAWKAGEERYWERPDGRPTGGLFPRLDVPILGPCDLLVSGGDAGGKVHVIDKSSGFEAAPNLQPEGDQGQVLALNVPSSCGYREIELTALTPGTVFYGIKCYNPQPYNPSLSFDHSWLPPCG